MDRKVILLAIISCINADHPSTNLLPPDLPPANVANIFHETGITFVSPSSNLRISSSQLTPPLPLTHTFGFIEHGPNGPQKFARSHSSQPITHILRSSVPVLSSSYEIPSNGQITSHRNAPQVSFNQQITVQSPPSDVVHARFVENENHGVHEINSRTQHFEYKVPISRTVPQHGYHAKHAKYGVPANIQSDTPTFIPSHGPSGAPSQIPSQIPLETPSFIPSNGPSSAPSQIPSQIPLETPSFIPSNGPSSAPSQIPSQIPLEKPSFIPSHGPSSAPSQIPSQIPSQTPTFIPSHGPSGAPSQLPSQIPLETPTFIPSHGPSGAPSQLPSQIPLETPSFLPSQDELNEPTFIPSQDEIDELPVFQNDKFLSPFVRRTKPPVTQTRPLTQTIDSIFDTPFRRTAPSRVNTFQPSVQSANLPVTQTQENILGDNHKYANRFSLSDGTKVSEQGKLISPQVGWENVIAKTGEYEYVSPEGIPVKVKWIADHQGFRVL